jgi:chromosome segregation ATPase
MATTPKLPLKLHERLGDEAMTELLTLFGDLGAETRAEFQSLRESDARLEARMEAGFTELRQEIGEVKQGLEKQIGDVKGEIADLRGQIADLKPHIVAVQSELIKWTFLFWLGTIGIVLLLLRFPP